MVSSPFITTFILLCVLGIFDAGYLVWKHRKNSHSPLVCPLNHDCSKVTESKWSKILGIRNEVLGALFYCFLLVWMLAFLFFHPPSAVGTMWELPMLILFGFFPLSLILITALGSFFSLLLIYIQFKIIKDYCFYCIVSAIITLLLFVNSLALG